MRESIGVGSRVEIAKTRIWNIPLIVIGEFRLERFARRSDGRCGRFLGEERAPNTIANKPFIMDLFTGVLDAHFSDSQAWLRVSNTSGGAATFDKASPDSREFVSAVNPNGSRVRRSYFDNTDNVYAANWLRLYNGQPGTTNTEDLTNSWHISELNPAWGNKPNTENWHYHHELEIFSADTDIQAAGMARLQEMLIGGNGGFGHNDHLSAATMFLQPRDASPVVNVGAAIAASSMTKPTTTSVEFTFVSPAGSHNGDWDQTIVYHDSANTVAANFRSGGCRQDGSSCGAKTAGEEWTYKWRMTI